MAYRIGDYRGGFGRLVWRSDDLPGRRQPGPRFAAHGTRTVVAPWRRSLTLDTTDWPAGFYVLRLRAATGWDTQVPYIVSSETARDTVALVTPVTTWQAYNEWGGYSLYAGPSGDRRAWAVSFDRPYYRVGGMNSFRTAVMPIVVRAEASGVPLSYFSNLDLHADPHGVARRPGLRLDGPRRVLDTQHAEARSSTPATPGPTWPSSAPTPCTGGSASTIARTGPMRLMTGYRDDAHLDPAGHVEPRADRSVARRTRGATENDLTGMLYECYPVDAPYRIVTPDWWGFRGHRCAAGHGDPRPRRRRVRPRLPEPPHPPAAAGAQPRADLLPR